jgi:hypothetical protein
MILFKAKEYERKSGYDSKGKHVHQEKTCKTRRR